MADSTETTFRDTERTPPWIAALRTVQGGVGALTATLAALAGLLAQTVGLLEQFRIPKGWPFVVLGLLTSTGMIAYLRVWQRERSGPPGVTMSVFIGAEPFTAREKDRFFGRSAEVDEITRKLRNPEVRFLVLFGQSGCGKTSLICAGVIPELERDGLACVYTRPYQHPEQSLKAALDQLSGRPGIIFFDQFEEFFTSMLEPEERRRFIEAIVACINSEGEGQPQLVFLIRRDFFDCLTEIDEYIGDIFTRSRRQRIEPFTIQNARTVIEKSLARDSVTWQPNLVDRVLDDLLIEARDGIASAPIVLPAELQIVCQMIQRRGWSDAQQYPGKERLIHDYVTEAIETSPNREQAKRILLKLIHENGVTRAQPRSAAEVAADIIGLTEQVAAKHLKHLDENCRLVNQVVTRDKASATTGISYELAHEYLVAVINQISGSVMDRTRRANALLQQYRNRSAMTDADRIPFADAMLIRRHATEAVTPADRKLLRRSIAAFLLRASMTVLIPTSVVLGLRYGTVHFGGSGNIYRGFPVLDPLFSSDDVVLDGGLDWNAYSDEAFGAYISGVWLWDTPGASRATEMLRRWRIERLRRLVETSDSDDPEERLRDPKPSEELAILTQSHSLPTLAITKVAITNSRSVMTLRRLRIPSKQILIELRRRLNSPLPEDRSVAALLLLQMGFSDAAIRTDAIDASDVGCSKIFSNEYDIDKPAEGHSDLMDSALARQAPSLMRDVLLRAVGSASIEDVRCATATLIRYGFVDDLQVALRRRLSDAESPIRVIAADGLLAIDPKDTDAIDVIVAALKTELWFEPAAFITERHRLRDSRVEAILLAALHNRRKAWSAAKTLATCGYQGNTLVTYLESLHPDHYADGTTASALLTTVEGPTPRMQRRLSELIYRHSSDVEQSAATALLRSRHVPAAVRNEVLTLRATGAKTREDLEEIRAAGYSDAEIESAFLDEAKRGSTTTLAVEFLSSRNVWTAVPRNVRRTLVGRSYNKHEIARVFARVEFERPGESPDASLERLHAELCSSDASRSRQYRYAVEWAVADVVIAEMKRKGVIDPMEFERRLLALTSAEPFQMRRAMLDAVGFIDDSVSLADVPKFVDSAGEGRHN